MTILNYRQAGLKAVMRDVSTFLDLSKMRHRALTDEESLALDEITQGFQATDGLTVLRGLMKINECGVHWGREFAPPKAKEAPRTSRHERQPGKPHVETSRSNARSRGFYPER